MHTAKIKLANHFIRFMHFKNVWVALSCSASLVAKFSSQTLFHTYATTKFPKGGASLERNLGKIRECQHLHLCEPALQCHECGLTHSCLLEYSILPSESIDGPSDL